MLKFILRHKISRGNYRVGSNFPVDLENERTSFDIESISLVIPTVRIKDANGTVTITSWTDSTR